MLTMVLALRGQPRAREVSKKMGETQVQLTFHPLLPDLDSNQDKQNQNLSYYHYTIGQSASPSFR